MTNPLPLIKPKLNPYKLGASLYMPAVRTDIWQVICRQKIDTVHSIIICLEDALKDDEVALGLKNIQDLLSHWNDNQQQTLNKRPLVFIRPRNVSVLKTLLEFKHIDLIDGFVLPKVDMLSLADWKKAVVLLPSHHFIMPTLETALVFDGGHNKELAHFFKENFYHNLLALRIGGNDLLACLRIRRLPNVSLYQSPLGAIVNQLIMNFVPQGFYLSSPVFEYLDKPDVFMDELTTDVALGLVGKTVIHPSQIGSVTQAFAVSQSEFLDANAILDAGAKAVFKQHNAMLEPATHKAWAEQVLARAEVFGVT